MKVALALLGASLATSVALDRKLYGVDYDVRTSEWGGCKQEWEIRADFQAMKQVARNVRVYGTEEPCISRVLKVAAEANVRLWLGLWGNIYADQDAFDKQFVTFKRLVAEGRIRNDNVVGMHVSSEAMFRYYIQDKHDWSDREGTYKLTAYVDKVRTFLRQHGLNFPVSIADVMDAYKYTQALYPAVDVVAANQFSQWENVWAKDGVNTMFERLKNIQISSRATGKQILIAETGWSSNGSFPSIKEATPESSGVYLKDFLLFAEQQNLNFYYFSSFNLKWGDDSAFGLIEKNWGLFDQDRNMLPHVRSVVVGKPHKAVRLWHNGLVIKVDGANTNTEGRVYLDLPTTGLTDSLDREVWFYDEDHKTFRSKSTNQCLDTYVDDAGVSQLHVYWCDSSNANQHWDFHADGTYDIMSVPEVEVVEPTTVAPTTTTTTVAPTDPPTDPPTAPPASVPQFYAECGDCRNCQFFTPYYSLCYANWSPRDCGLMPKSTHRWCGSLPTYVAPPATRKPTTTTRRPSAPRPSPSTSTAAPGVYLGPKPVEVRVPVGVLVSLSDKSPGKCIRAATDGLQVVPCSFDDSTKFSIRPFETEEVTIKIVDTDWKITESFGRVVATTNAKLDVVHPDAQTWFYDPLAKTIRNKANSQSCLQLVQDKVHGLVEGRLCDADNAFQAWSYNDLTGQIYFMEKMGLCLATDGPNQPLHVQFCDITIRNQKWIFELGHHGAGDKKPAPPPCQYTNPSTLPPCTTKRPVPPPCEYTNPTTTQAPARPPSTTEAPVPPTTTAAPITTTTPAPATTTTAAPTTTTPTPTTTVAPTDAPTTVAPVVPDLLVEETDAPQTTRARRPLPSPCDKNEMANTTVAPTTTMEVPTTTDHAGESTVTKTKRVVISHNKPKTTQAPVPSEELQVTDVPAPPTDAPTTAAPATDAPTTAAPATDAPTTAAPATDAPTTAAPATDAPTTAAPATDAPTTTAPVNSNTLDLATCIKYKVVVGDSSWGILNKACSGYSGACKKDALPTIVNSQNKRCSSLLTVGEEVSVCCGSVPITAPTDAPTTPAPTDAPSTPAPTDAPSTAAPTDAPSTAAPTDAPSTAAPTDAPTTTVVDSQVTDVPAPTDASTTAVPAGPAPVPNEPVAFINYFVEQHACVGFGATWCAACEWTKETVADVGGKLTFMELDTKVAGEGPAGDAISAALTTLTGSNSYPSIWIGGKYIGSSDKIADLDAADKLTDLLKAAGCL